MIRSHIFAILILPVLSQAVIGLEAKVLSTVGGVHLQRGEQAKMARERVQLLLGDKIHTSHDSGASLLIDNCIVYLGPNTSTQIGVNEVIPVLTVDSGNVRAVITGTPGLRIKVRSAAATMTEGILSVTVDKNTSSIASIEGLAEITGQPRDSRHQVELVNFAPDETTTLQPGQEVVVPENGGLNHPQSVLTEENDDDEKLIDVELLQKQAADAAQRQVDQYEDMRAPAQNSNANAQSNRGVASSQNNVATAPGFGLGFGSAVSASFSGSASSATFGDAGLATPFLVDAMTNPDGKYQGIVQPLMNETSRRLNGAILEAGELFGDRVYSVIEGPAPTKFVTTLNTANDSVPIAGSGDFGADTPGEVLAIPNFSGFLVLELDFDSPGVFELDDISSGIQDGSFPGAIPQPKEATLLSDDSATFSDLFTSSIGEFRIEDGGGVSAVEVSLRRADYDRDLNTGEKHPELDDSDYEPILVSDADFEIAPGAETFLNGNGFADTDTVYTTTGHTGSFPKPSFSKLDAVRKAALTTIMADNLQEFAKRTNQTRFVIDGTLIDISGYKP